MPIICDCHMHSHHSTDSEATMESMVEAALAKGLETICFTEHQDFVYPPIPEKDGPDPFMLNADSYLYELLSLREKYKDRIRIEFGVELGLQLCCLKENLIFGREHEYDFIIGSIHLIDGQDPYYPDTFEGRTDTEVYRRYFECMLENIRKFHNFDVLGHLDYVLRYGPGGKRDYKYSEYGDILDEIFGFLIENEKGIELNTGGIKKGMKEFHPCMEALKRYRELGGEIITIGSDAHKPENVADHFDRVPDVLKEAGFKYYCIYENRLPEYHKL
ncbi:MAG: histidinol-phosphatase HisJ family protein [Lachnospiraceae bacterium]|nr:histidinol-phosphatase HisJ family protein [Lachnospiraceae bacterium]